MAQLYSSRLHFGYSTPNLFALSGHTDHPLDTARSLADDDFQDAADYWAHTKSVSLLDTIAETKVALKLFLNNQFEDAENCLKPLSHKTMYHALGYSSILFLKALMTCDRADMERAFDATQNAQLVIQRYRAQYSIADSLYRLSGQYKSLTEEEVHAELCYAESLMTRACLTFFYDENLTSFIKGAFKIRSCYQSYKECQRILHSQQWTSSTVQVQREFESGVRLGIGGFSVMLSILPSKVLRLLEVIGFSGDKLIGMKDLHISADMDDTLRSVMAKMALVSWQLFVVYFIGEGKPDIPLCQRCLSSLVYSYPDGAIIHFLRARYYLVNCDIDTAVYFYNKSIECQEFYRQFHHICYWELQFAYAILRRWDRSANNAKRLKDESRWSRCVYNYLLAIYINADLTVPEADRDETVSLIMNKIPNIRLRIAGKSIPVEKFCERKAKRYLAERRLFFAHYEFMYFWNAFTILEAKPEPHIPDILEDMESFWARQPSGDANDICMYEFLRGVCLKTMRLYTDAIWCFNRVIGSVAQLTDNYYLVPTALFELAITKREMGQYDECEALLNRAKSHRGYSMENKLHFRIHAAMETLRGLPTI